MLLSGNLGSIAAISERITMTTDSANTRTAARLAAMERKGRQAKDTNQKTAEDLAAELAKDAANQPEGGKKGRGRGRRPRPERQQEHSNFTLPLLPAGKSAMPHPWTRSALFSPGVIPTRDDLDESGHRQRETFIKTIIASRNDAVLRYTGERLDMADSDVFLHVIRLSQGLEPGERIHFVRSQFLQSIGRTLGTSSYEWLKRSLERLVSATLFEENVASTKGRTMRLVDEMAWDHDTDEYWLTLDPHISQFFNKKEIAHIDFEARLRLKAPLAKWLQNYSAGHRTGEWHCISVENLRIWSGSGPMKNFMAKGRGLAAALEELVEAGIIEQFEFYEAKEPGERRARKMVKWWKPSDFAQTLRDYANQQALGWHEVTVRHLFGISEYPTLKGFMAKGRGLPRALGELERGGIITKVSLAEKLGPDAQKVVLVRWYREAEVEPKIGT